VPLLALPVGEGAHSEKVRSVEQPPAIVKAEALTAFELFRDVPKARRGETRV
jgi:hypothetical protein